MCWWDVKPYSVSQSDLTLDTERIHVGCVLCSMSALVHSCCRYQTILITVTAHRRAGGALYTMMDEHITDSRMIISK